MVTSLKDIAELAGVSTATVSRALNSPQLVSKSLRRKVDSAIVATNYTPNVNAKRLRTQKAHAVLIVSPDVSDPFCARIVQGVENAAAALSYAVLLGDSRGDSKQARVYANMVRSGHVDGLIYFGIREPYELPVPKSVSRRDLHIVNICNYTGSRLPNVGIDNVDAALVAVRHLAELGHKRIGVVAGLPKHPETIARLRGLEDAVRCYGLERSDDLIAYGDFTFESGIAACQSLLEKPLRPTAIFCHNDRMALGAVQALWNRKLKIPDDMSVVGFDDLEFARFSCPPLTTVAQPMYEIGTRAMTMLYDLIQGAKPPSSRELLPVKLIVRSSTTVPPRRN